MQIFLLFFSTTPVFRLKSNRISTLLKGPRIWDAMQDNKNKESDLSKSTNIFDFSEMKNKIPSNVTVTIVPPRRIYKNYFIAEPSYVYQ